MKQFLWALTIWGMLCSVLPVISYAQTDAYTITASEDQTAEVGDTVTVPITVSHGDNQCYNAYDLMLLYDSSRLELTQIRAPDSSAVITRGGSSLRIQGYGENKPLSTPVAVLTFRAAGAGRASVRIRTAAVDESSRAKTRNAPAAVLADDTTLILIEAAFPVTLGEGLQAESLSASNGQDYIFTATDIENYDYQPSAVINGSPVSVEDMGNGSYRIPGGEINGPVAIESNRAPKSYQVLISGEDAAGSHTASYNTPYSFRLERKEGYQYTVSVTIGGKSYSGYTVSGDTYTIPGTDITGDIRITVTKTLDDSDYVRVTFAGSGEKDGSGQKKTKRNVEYPFKIKQKKGYTYSISVSVGGRRVSWDYDADLDTYYILSEHVTGDIIISVTKVPTVEISEYITLDEQSMYLILYNGHVKNGQVPRYDGQVMYWSADYRGYAWLVVSEETMKNAKKTAEAAITVSEGEPAAVVYRTSNVNLSGRTDEQDVQLAFRMYNACHTLTDMEMVKFLHADYNGDRRVNVMDAAALVNAVSGGGGT